MASLSWSKKTGRGRIIFVMQNTDGRRERKVLWLGRVPRKAARTIKVHVEALIVAKVSKSGLEQPTAEWLGDILPELRGKLVNLGLADPPTDDPAAAPSAVPTVRQFIDAYLADRRAVLKWRTLNNAEQDRNSLCRFLGDGRPLDAVTPGDADDFAVWLRRDGFAPATIGRRLKRCKQYFRAAVRKRLIGDNPFADVKPPAQVNDARKCFVTSEDAERLIDAARDSQWRLIIALARYGGLRTPSETLALTWGDVDWERERLRVPSPKTEHLPGGEAREIPLFLELRPHLEAAFHEAEPGTIHVINRYRDAKQNLRTQLLRIIRRAGLTPWERVFHNMRASRETELAATFPVHVVCRWIGNTERIAQKHYLAVRDEDFDAAVGRARGATRAGADEASHETTEADISLEMSASGKSCPVKDLILYPQGESNPCPLAENQIS